MGTAKTFAKLTIGTVINFNRCTTADNTNFVVLRQYEPLGKIYRGIKPRVF